MNLKIEEYQLPAEIQFNFDEIKLEISEKLKKFENLVYTDDQVKDAKSDRASLNKLKKALQDENDIVTEDKHGMLGLSYTEIIADLVGICQKQQQRIDDLEERLKTIEALLEGDGK